MATTLLTGASGGIGKAIATGLTEAGHAVIGVERAEADLSIFSDVQKLERKIQKGSQLDWVVCAHGYIDTETNLEEQQPENIAQTFDVNVLSLFYLAKVFLKHLAPGGGMVVVSSTAGLQANGRFAAYSASKAAANSFVQALARSRESLNFFSVCPGPTNTAMRQRVAGDAAKMQNPSVVADVVVKMISKRGSYQSGDVVSVRDSVVSKVGEIT